MKKTTAYRAIVTKTTHVQMIHDPVTPLTWADVVKWCEGLWRSKRGHCKRGKVAAAFCEAQMTIHDPDEPTTTMPEFLMMPVWDETTRWIAVYWVPGDSEGYYIHVERIMRKAPEQPYVRRWAMMGKVFAQQQAILVTTTLQTYINSFYSL